MTDEPAIRRATAADAPDIHGVARGSWHAAYDSVLGAERVDEVVSLWYDPERLVANALARAASNADINEERKLSETTSSTERQPGMDLQDSPQWHT